jgi:hypothetical protein
MSAVDSSVITTRDAGSVPGSRRFVCRLGRVALARTARLLVLAVLAGAAAAAWGAENSLEGRVKTLFGYWLAQSEDASHARVLRITNVIFAEPASAVLAGFYGPPSATLAEAKDITARPEGGNVVLDIVAADDTRITLTTTAGGRLRGAAKRPDGAASALHFSRASLPEVHRFVAEQPPPRARARRGSRIELVYIGADDCSLCRAWEAAYLGRGKLAGSAEWKHLHFTTVKLATLSTAFRVEHAPRRLQPVFSEMLDSGVRIHGVPSFVLLVDGGLRVHALGPAAFDTLVHPALRAAVREKLTGPGVTGSSPQSPAR